MSEENKTVKTVVAEKLIAMGQSLLEKKEGQTEKVEMMAQGVLTDGTRIVTPADAWTEGVEIFVETEGEPVPLAPGEYTLEDGTIMVVEQEGILNEIKPMEEPAMEPTEAANDDKDKDNNKMDEQKVKAIVETLVKEYKFASVEKLTELEAKNKELGETIVMLSDALTNLSKPYEDKKAEKETKPEPVALRDATKLEGESKLAAIRERYSAMQN